NSSRKRGKWKERLLGLDVSLLRIDQGSIGEHKHALNLELKIKSLSLFLALAAGSICDKMVKVNILASTRSDEQLVPIKARLSYGKSNLLLDLQKMQKNHIFCISVDILQNSNFFKEFIASQLLWNTLSQEAKSSIYSFQLDDQWFTLDDNLLCKALEIAPVDATHPFVSPPAVEVMGGSGSSGEGLGKRERWLQVVARKLGSEQWSFETWEGEDITFTKDPGHLFILRVMTFLSLISSSSLKPVKKKTTKPSPSKKASKGKVRKVRKGKSPLKLLNEYEEVQHEPEPQGKGKGIATDEQAVQSLLDLHKPKKKIRDTSSPANAEIDLEEKTTEIDKGHAGSDPCKTPESRPPPERVLIEEDQAGPNLRQSHVALAGPNPKPMHDVFVATVYVKVYESLKHTTKEHVHLENPLCSSGTLSSMKNLEDNFTFGDQFINDKPKEEDPGKTNAETKVESIVTFLFNPVIDLTPPKLVSSTVQEPVVCANFEKRYKIQDKTVQGLSTRVFMLELRDLPHKIDQTVNEVVKEAVQTALQAPLREHFSDLSEADIKEILYQRMFESSSYKSHLEHKAFYEALKVLVDHDNQEALYETLTTSRKRRRDDQDPPPPPIKDFDRSKKKKQDSDASASQQAQGQQSSAWKTSDTREAQVHKSLMDTNCILKELLRTLKPNSPAEEPKGSDDYTEVTYDKEQCLSDHYTTPITPLAYTPSIPFLATMEPLDTLLMGDMIISIIPERENECSMPIDPPLPCTNVLGDAIVDIDLLLGEHLDTLSTGDTEIEFNPIRDIEELERLLADDHVLVPRVFDEPLVGKTRVMKTPSFSSHHMPSPRPVAYSPKEVMISYDLVDLRACFQSSNHAVSGHLHVYIMGILNPDHIYVLFPLSHLEFFAFAFFIPKCGEILSDESKVHIEVLSVLWENRLPGLDGGGEYNNNDNLRLIKVCFILSVRMPDVVAFKKVEENSEVEIRLLALSHVDDVSILDDVHISDSEDTGNAHISNIKTRPDWLKHIGKKKLSKGDLEGPAFKVVRSFHQNSLHLQFQMEECHLLLTDQFDLMNPKGDKERRHALSISKMKASYYPDFGLKELVPSMWIKSERVYDICATYGITHWNLVIRHRVEDLQLGIKIYQTKLNLTQPSWDAFDFQFKEDYTIGHKPRAMIYRDRNNQKKMMRETKAWTRGGELKMTNEGVKISSGVAEYINTPSWNRPTFYNHDEDDDKDYTIAITPNFPITDSLSLGDEHLSTIPETESDELIKSSVENLVPNPSKSEDLSDIQSECDVPDYDDFTTFSNSLFDDDDNFSTCDDESLSDKDVSKEIYSNPLFDEEIISIKIDLHHFNTESDLIESWLNQDSSIISSPKIDSLLEDFFGELAHIDLILSGINEADFNPEKEIRLVEKLLYDNSSPRPLKKPYSEM
nr:hypothetical protein [Tanacetum cinerariifolium]